jgi:virulence factor Mce-like protein
LGPVIIALAAGGMYLGIKAAYGGFGHYYYVTAALPRAGQELEVGSDVRMRGVVVGRVSDIELADRSVRLTLQIDHQYKVPASAEAVVSLKTLLGAKFIDLRFASYAAPFLADGGRVRAGVVGPELEDALADGVNVLDAIRPGDLATIIVTLAHAARGHGEEVARALRANAALSTIFARTLRPQERSLYDFDVVFGALRTKGVDLNRLADAINQGVPVYASARAQRDLRAALTALTPFANNLADLFLLDRAQWDRMIDSGDTVLTGVSSRPEGLRSLVRGLYRYVFKLSGNPCSSQCLLDDGSGAAGFVNFIGGDNSAQTFQQLCAALPPDVRDQVPLCNGSAP